MHPRAAPAAGQGLAVCRGHPEEVEYLDTMKVLHMSCPCCWSWPSLPFSRCQCLRELLVAGCWLLPPAGSLPELACLWPGAGGGACAPRCPAPAPLHSLPPLTSPFPLCPQDLAGPPSPPAAAAAASAAAVAAAPPPPPAAASGGATPHADAAAAEAEAAKLAISAPAPEHAAEVLYRQAIATLDAAEQVRCPALAPCPRYPHALPLPSPCLPLHLACSASAGRVTLTVAR